jgi:hypothetical protein
MDLLKVAATGLAAVWLVGCASAPEQVAQIASPDAAVSAEPSPDGLEPVVVELKAREFDPDVVYTCRDMLKPGSNVIVRYCGTGAEWKKLEAEQARMAREMLRTMQRGLPY